MRTTSDSRQTPPLRRCHSPSRHILLPPWQKRVSTVVKIALAQAIPGTRAQTLWLCDHAPAPQAQAGARRSASLFQTTEAERLFTLCEIDFNELILSFFIPKYRSPPVNNLPRSRTGPEIAQLAVGISSPRTSAFFCAGEEPL